MIDPSLLLLERTVDWLEIEGASRQQQIVVSRSFASAVANRSDELQKFLPPSSRPARGRLERVAGFIGELETFDYDSTRLDDLEGSVLGALLQGDSLTGRIFADEWAYLNSHSWLVAHTRKVLDALRNAGAVVVEYGEKLRDQLVRSVVPTEAPPITPLLLGRVGVKWLILGGASVGLELVSPLPAPVGVLAAPVVRAFDP